MTDKKEVRIATRADEAQLMDLCRALHKENGLFELDEDMVRTMLYRAFNREGGIIGVIDGDNEIAACIFALLSNFWYSKDSHIEELFSYVRPNFRRSNYADLLIEFMKRCATEIGIPLVIGVITSDRAEAKVRLYRRKLGVPAGAFFVYNSVWNNDNKFNDSNLWKVHAKKRKEIINAVTPATMTTSAVPMLSNGG